MSNRSGPDPRYKGDSTSFRRLDKAINRAIARNSQFAFEYESETLQLHLAELLHTLRTEAHLSQTELAARAGMSQPFVARLENPISDKQPSLETLAKIARVFNKRVIIGLEDIAPDSVRP